MSVNQTIQLTHGFQEIAMLLGIITNQWQPCNDDVYQPQHTQC